MERATLKSAFLTLVIAAVATSASPAGAASGLGFPTVRPTSAVTVAVSPECDGQERPLVGAFLTRLQESARRKDSAFLQIDWRGSRYVVFQLKPAGLTLDQFLHCLPVHFGTVREAQHIDLLVPAHDIPNGVMLYTPVLGFYGDPRAWHMPGH